MPDKLLPILFRRRRGGAYAGLEGPAEGGLRNGVEQWRGTPGTLESRDLKGIGAGFSRETRGMQGMLASIK